SINLWQPPATNGKLERGTRGRRTPPRAVYKVLFLRVTHMSVIAHIGLGSNLGDRRDYLDRALQALQELPGIEVIGVSSYQETAPVGGPPGQGNYLNAAAELRTELAPDELLRVLLEVEETLGRVRSEWHG